MILYKSKQFLYIYMGVISRMDKKEKENNKLKIELFKKGFDMKTIDKYIEIQERDKKIKWLENELKSDKYKGLQDSFSSDNMKNKNENINLIMPKENVKVKLNYDRITSNQSYIIDKETFKDSHRQNFIDFIESNKDTIFTTQYDIEYMEKCPDCICFNEDNKLSKWAFHYSDIIIVK